MYRRIIHHTHSIQYAAEGMKWAFFEHKNYQIHALLSFLSILGGLYLGFDTIEWIILVITITFGFVIETLNTAIETTLDVVDTTIRHDIKIAKDVSAGAMLWYSIGALIIAGLLFIPKIFI